MKINLIQEARRLAFNNGVSNTTLLFLIEEFGALTAFKSVTTTVAKNAISNYDLLKEDLDDRDYEEQIVERESAEYLQGKRDVELWREDKLLFGNAYAEQMQLDREFNEY